MATRKGFPPSKTAPGPAHRGAQYKQHLRSATIPPKSVTQAPTNSSDYGPEATRGTLTPAEQTELAQLDDMVLKRRRSYNKDQGAQDRYKALLAKKAGVR